MKKIFTAALFICIAAAAQAQTLGTIHVEQHPLVEELLRKHVAYNLRNPKISGYRIRIYRDNGSNARGRSESIAASFNDRFPEIPAYRGYDNPYFKVSVGAFRSKNEAMKFYTRIKSNYPHAYIVAESINLPPL
jgi:hypothetical protein